MLAPVRPARPPAAHRVLKVDTAVLLFPSGHFGNGTSHLTIFDMAKWHDAWRFKVRHLPGSASLTHRFRLAGDLREQPVGGPQGRQLPAL